MSGAVPAAGLVRRLRVRLGLAHGVSLSVRESGVGSRRVWAWRGAEQRETLARLYATWRYLPHFYMHKASKYITRQMVREGFFRCACLTAIRKTHRRERGLSPEVFGRSPLSNGSLKLLTEATKVLQGSQGTLNIHRHKQYKSGPQEREARS